MCFYLEHAYVVKKRAGANLSLTGQKDWGELKNIFPPAVLFCKRCFTKRKKTSSEG